MPAMRRPSISAAAILRARPAAVTAGRLSGERADHDRTGPLGRTRRLPQCPRLTGEGARAGARGAPRSRAASTGERISSDSSSPPGRATAPPASRHDQLGRRGVDRADRAQASAIASSWPRRHQAERHRHRAERADAARAQRTRCGSAAAATSSGRAVSSPSTSSGPGWSGGRRSPSQNAPSPLHRPPVAPRRGSSPDDSRGRARPRSRPRRRPCGDRRRPRSTRRRTAGLRLALSEPSTGSTTTAALAGPSPISTSPALLRDRDERDAERLELREDRVLGGLVDHVARCRRPRRGRFRPLARPWSA